jgi:uncharacterized membrane protein
MNDLNDPAHYKFGLLYYNSKDSRTVIPKRNKSLGWTLNFAKPGAYFFLLLIIVIVLVSIQF